jgi:hypothetical protein
MKTDWQDIQKIGSSETSFVTEAKKLDRKSNHAKQYTILYVYYIKLKVSQILADKFIKMSQLKTSLYLQEGFFMEQKQNVLLLNISRSCKWRRKCLTVKYSPIHY